MARVPALFAHPLFSLGLLAKLFLIVAIEPAAPVRWFVPFMEATLADPGFDPWATWTAQGGDPAAFPYGFVMWLVFLPGVVLAKLCGVGALFGYQISLLVADLVILICLARLVSPIWLRRLLLAYWCSPIVLIATYGLGFNDIIPVTGTVLALWMLRISKPLGAGLALATGTLAKLSMVLVWPFFLIYALHNRAIRARLPRLVLGLGLGAIGWALPYAFSPQGLTMLLGNQEIQKVFRLAVQVGPGLRIYIVPLLYCLMLYFAWRIKRLNFELFHSLLGLAFLLVVLFAPAAPGWFVWVAPMLALYQVAHGRSAQLFGLGFGFLYVLNVGLTQPGLQSVWGPVALPWTQLPPGVLVLIHSLMTTAMLAVGLVLAARIWRETVHDNDFFRLSRKPFVIGISGDSGAGKDTLAEALRDLFGGHSVASLSGDDYHLWDRHKPMWQVMTHLNPLANDLESFARDLISLCDGRTILTRHYDHATGKMSRPYRVPSNDIIIASGLHALHLPILRSAYDLSIYLDIDEDLRRYLKLKRDVRQRGHAKARVLQSLARRQPDSEKFIRPQRDHADLVFSMRPVSPRFIQDIECAPDFPMRLVVHSRNELNEASLTRVLVGLCGLHVDTQAHPDGGIELSIEGEVEAADVQLASRLMFPKLLEFLDSEPGWVGGVTGLMQLVTLSHINQALTRRFLQ